MENMYQERKALFYLKQLSKIVIMIIGGRMSGNKLMGLFLIIIGLVFGFIMHPISPESDIIVFPLVGLLIIIGLVIGSRKAYQEELRDAVITTKIKEVADYYHDGDTTYYIITSWVNPADQKLYIFKNYISDEDEKRIKELQIKELPVRYETGNIENYKIDLEGIKEVNHEKNQ